MVSFIDPGARNYLSQLLSSSGSMQPSFMEPARPAYGNAVTDAARMGGVFQNSPVPPQPQAAPPQSQAVPPRRRNSLVDILGAFADTAAELGGLEGGYQPRLDARRERERQAEADQMAREEFALNKQKFGLETRKTEFDILRDQNEVLGLASMRMSQALQQGGPEGALRMWSVLAPRLGMTPEQMAQADAQLRADPEGFVTALSALAEGGSAEFGVTPVIDEEGNAWQLSKSGGARPVDLQGRKVTRGVKQIDRGNYVDVVDGLTGELIASYPKGGVPSADQAPVPGGGLAPIPGSTLSRKAQSEATEEVRGLEGLEIAFNTSKGSIERAKQGLQDMKKAGSLIAKDSGQTMIGRAKATVFNNANWLEAIVNPDGSTGRDIVNSAALELTRSFDAVKNEVTNNGETPSSTKLMDTIKEAQANLEKAVNTRNYDSAMDAIKAYERDVLAKNGLLQQYLAEAKAKRARLQSGSPAAAPSGGNRIRYDAQGNRIQ